MAKNVIQSTILSINGGVSVAPGASIEIRNAASGQLMPLWLDRNGTQPTLNPTTADGNGFFRVYTDAGRVHITASKDGKTQEWRDVVLPPDLYIGKSTATPAAPITGSLLSGAMLAAGAIVEWGSNANGEYWRYESGLQICRGRKVFSTLAVTTATAGGLYRNISTDSTTSLPAAFVSTAYELSVLQGGEIGDLHGSIGVYQSFPVAPGGFRFFSGALSSATYTNYPIQFLAIGRWK